MLLRDATSKEQVADALDAGDEELREDIDEQLNEAARQWSQRGDYCEYDDLSFKDFLRHPTEEFVDRVIEKSAGGYDLSNAPREEIESQLASDSISSTGHALGRRGPRVGPFELSEHRGREFSFELPRSLNCWFPAHLYPDNAEFIPESIAREFWTEHHAVRYVTWEQPDSFVDGNTGYADGESSFIVADSQEFAEWCRDIVGSAIGNLIEKDPAKAREMFWSDLKDRVPDLARKLQSLKPSDDDILSLTAQWFDRGADQDEILREISDYVGSLSPTDEAREAEDVLAEVTEDDLRQLGITSGTLWEERPWKLVNLQPHQLPLEGALMNHCVGERGMGYIKAVRDGEVQIWSLRSRANKPRFTLEVDGSFGADAAEARRIDPTITMPAWRGVAIKQLKGKGNRTPGYADKHATTIKFPHEVTLWRWLFGKLGVDPDAVDDFHAYRRQLAEQAAPQPNRRSSRRTSRRRTSRRVASSSPRRNTGEACVGFDQPYRPLVELSPER